MTRAFLAVTAAVLLVIGFISPSTAAPSDVSTRIVNGSNADITQVPWQVPIMIRNTSQQFCGGTLIDTQWVLTAAHCMFYDNAQTQPIPASALKIAYGVSNRSQFATTNNVNVSQKYVYENYDNNTNFGDLALLHLANAVPLSSSAQLATLPAQSGNVPTWPTNGTSATVSGWGDLSYGGSAPAQLQVATVVVKDNVCPTVYGWFNVSAMVCANGGTSQATTDTCQGDSGGPFVIQSGGQNIVAGVTSTGYQCAVWADPGVYTRVSDFADWITTKTNTMIPPGVPTQVTAAAGKASANVQWAAPTSSGGSAITGYVVTGSDGSTCRTAGETSCTVSPLQPGISVTFTVVAVNAIGEGFSSDASNAVVPYAAPGQVSNVKVVAKTAKLEVSWVAPQGNGDDAITYTMTIKPAASACTQTSATSCTYSGLVKNQPYEIEIVASNAGGAGVPSVPVVGVPVSVMKDKGDVVKYSKLKSYSALKIKKNADISYALAGTSSSVCALNSSGAKLKKKASTCKVRVVVKNPGKKKTSQVVYLGTK